MHRTAKGPAGDVRAFDAITGKLVWSFHTLPRPGEPGYETWGPNFWEDGSGPSVWAGITVDQDRGLVFVPTGQPGGGSPPGESRRHQPVRELRASRSMPPQVN